MQILELLVVLAMVFVNAFFAAYEIALASVSIGRLQVLADEGRRGATAGLHMKVEIEESLAVVQLGITLVGLIAGATGGASASEDIAPVLRSWGIGDFLAEVLSVAAVVIPLTIVTIVIGELVPKLFALRNKEWVCLTLSPMMKWFARSAWPAVWALDSSASRLMHLMEAFWKPNVLDNARSEAAELQELRAITTLASASRLIGAREENIILGATNLATRKLSEIAIPVKYIHMLSLADTISDSLVAAYMDMHTRFPVTKTTGDPQAIVGYVTFKDIVSTIKLNPTQSSLQAILREIPVFDSAMPISAAMEQLLREHTHIALVQEAGVTIGMITQEDVIEELLGDIQDEYDMLPIHLIRTGSGWVAGGGASLDRIEEVTGINLRAAENVHNLNAWIMANLGKVPKGGETVLNDKCRAVIRKVRRDQVLEALISDATAAAPQAEHNTGRLPNQNDR